MGFDGDHEFAEWMIGLIFPEIHTGSTGLGISCGIHQFTTCKGDIGLSESAVSLNPLVDHQCSYQNSYFEDYFQVYRYEMGMKPTISDLMGLKSTVSIGDQRTSEGSLRIQPTRTEGSPMLDK